MISLDILPALAHKDSSINKAFFKNIKPGKARLLDNITHQAHHQVFEKINCLDCGNCCKSLGPRLNERDIRQMAKATHLKPSAFEEKYLQIDEDGDYIFKNLPCPFLMNDNYCSVYENRPKACREYPHTHQPEILKKSKLHIINSTTCPAVFEILENIRKTWI
jgi:uncharacterized protein